MASSGQVRVTFGAEVSGFLSALDSVDSATAKTSQWQRRFKTDMENLSGAYGKLVAALDPVAAGQQRIAVATELANNAFKTGIIGATQYEAVIERINSTMGKTGGITSGATRELMILGHEMMTGNFTRMPGTLMVLAERMGGLSLATMGTVGAFAALAFGSYELIEHLVAAQREVDAISNDMALMGRGADASTPAIKSMADQLIDKFGLSGSEARGVVKAIEDIPRASDQTRASLQALGTVWAQTRGATDEKGIAKEIGEIAAAAAHGAQGVRSFGEKWNLLTSAQMEALDVAQDENNVFGAQDILVAALTKRVGELAKQSENYKKTATLPNPEFGDSNANFDPSAKKPKASELAGAAPSEGDHAAYDASLKMVAQAKQGLADVAATWTEGKAQLDQLEVATWESVVNSGQLGGKKLLEADRELAAARSKLRRDSESQAIEDARNAEARKEAAAGGMSSSDRLASQAASQRALLTNAAITDADTREKLETELNTTLAKLGESRKEDELRRLEEVASATRGGSIERIAAEKSVFDYASTTWGQYSTQAKAALASVTAAEKEHATESRELEKLKVDGQQAVGNIQLQAEKDRLDAEVAAGNMTVLEKIAALQKLTDAAYQENLKRLDDEIRRLGAGTEAWQQAMNRRSALVAQHDATTARSAEQVAQAEKAAALKTAEAWESAFEPAQRAAESMFQGVFQGSQNMSQVAARAAGNMLLSYTEAFAGMALKRAAFEVADSMAWTKMSDGLAQQINSSSMAWIFGEVRKTTATTSGEAARTGATATGTAARNAMGATENAGFFSRVAAQVASWLGLETGKTAETTAGVTTRAAEETTATAVSIAEVKAQAVGEIPALTGVAMIGAAAAMASIPYIGPALAIAAATEMGVLGASCMAMASAAGGWGQVPFDGAITELHKDEMVLPASIAGPLRAMTAAAGGANAGGGTVNTSAAAGGGDTHLHLNINAIDTQGMIGALSSPQVQKFIARSSGAYHANNPSARGSY